MSSETTFFSEHQQDLEYAIAFLVLFCALFLLMNGIKGISRCWRRQTPQAIEDTESGLQDPKHAVNRSISRSTADTIGAPERRESFSDPIGAPERQKSFSQIPAIPRHEGPWWQ
jgi:hypothetical protein